MVVFMEDIIRSSREGGGGDEASACWLKRLHLVKKKNWIAPDGIWRKGTVSTSILADC